MTTPPAGPPYESPYGGQAAPPPTCYRHPDRESYVRCQRCNRPICPDCQTPASVGFQCPECIRAGARSTPATRTVLGGIVPRGDGAVVTKVIIAICVAVYIAQMATNDSITVDFSLVGGAYLPSGQVIGVADGQFYRLLTAAFLHGSITHLAVNMISLWLIGPPLEQMLGRARYITLYLVGALGGSALSYFIGAPNVPSVGASGAIFALFGALIAIAHKQRLSLVPYIAMLALNAVIGFLNPGIDWRAHVGGLVTGVVLGGVAAYAPRPRRDLWQLLAVAGMLAIAVALIVIRTVDLQQLLQ